jgi:hypothetical protein
MDLVFMNGKLFGSQAEAQHAAVTSAKLIPAKISASRNFFNDRNKLYRRIYENGNDQLIAKWQVKILLIITISQLTRILF